MFFHNGVFTSLTDVVGFYVRRDTNPEQWYPTAADGSALIAPDTRTIELVIRDIAGVPERVFRWTPST